MDTAQKYNEKQLRTLFEAFDVEKKGYIEIAELYAALRALDINISLLDLKQCINMYGYNCSSRTISYELFVNLISNYLPKPNTIESYKSIFKVFCGDSYPKLTLNSLLIVLDELEIKYDVNDMKEMFELSDKNNNGYITEKEFIDIICDNYDLDSDG